MERQLNNDDWQVIREALKARARGAEEYANALTSLNKPKEETDAQMSIRNAARHVLYKVEAGAR